MDRDIRWHFDRDAGGNPVQIIGITRDISERKLAESQLQENLDFQRVLNDVASDLVGMRVETQKGTNI